MKFPKQEARDKKAHIENSKPAPRTLAELTKAYSELAQQHGNLDYQRRCLEAECERTWQMMLQVNSEAAERNELDKKASLVAVPEASAPSQQTATVLNPVVSQEQSTGA